MNRLKNLKKFAKKELEKMREMSFAEKRWYIWEYYKVHIAALSLVLFLVGYFINLHFNPRQSDYMYIAWLGVPAHFAQLHDLEDALSVIVQDPELQTVSISDYSYVENNPQVNSALSQRLRAMLQLREIDAFISNREGIVGFYFVGYIRAVDEMLEELQRINPALNAALEDRLHMLCFEELDEFRINAGVEEPLEIADPYARYAIAISLEGSPLLEEIGIDSSDVYLGVIVNSQRLYAVAKALEVLLYGA